METVINLRKTTLLENLKKDVNDKLAESLTSIQNNEERVSDLSWRITPILYKFAEEWNCLTYANDILKKNITV